MLLTQVSGPSCAKPTSCATHDPVACRQASGSCAGPSSRRQSLSAFERWGVRSVPEPYRWHARTKQQLLVVRSVASGELRAVEGPSQARTEDDAKQSGPSAWVPGLVHRIRSPDELKDFLRTFQDQLVCLMCKATGCRPCKAFERKYKACAEEYQDVVFLEIYGDETIETRKLMIALQVKSTPTFMMFKHKGPVHTHSGTSDSKLRNALNEHTGRQEEELMSETDS